MRYFLLAILIVLPIMAACSGDDDDDNAVQTSEAAVTATETVVLTPIITTGPTAATISPAVCPANPDPATDDQIHVDVPQAGYETTSPLNISGVIAAFEATYNARVVDGAGNEIIANFVGMASEGQTLAPFEANLEFSVTEATPACLEIFTRSSADNSVQDVYQVQVLLLP